MIHEYIAYLRDVRRYSPRTQTLYQEALTEFCEWTGDTLDPLGLGMTKNLIPSRIREYEAHRSG